jgi:acyl-CoA-binding protein
LLDVVFTFLVNTERGEKKTRVTSCRTKKGRNCFKQKKSMAVVVPPADDWREGPHGSGIRFHWTHGGTPEEFLNSLQIKVDALVRDASSHYSTFSSDANNASNVEDVLDVAQALYVPIPVAIQSIALESTLDPLVADADGGGPPAAANSATIVLLDPSTATNVAEEVLEDLWTPVHLAIMAQCEHHITWMLKFHASYALKIMKELSRRKIERDEINVTSLVTTVGEDARAILIDEICAEEDNGGSMSDELNAKHVACALVPFFKALAKSPHFMTSLSSTSVSGEASLGAAFTGVAPALQRAGAGQASTASEVRLKMAIKGFMESLHDESLTPTTPTSTARTTVRSVNQPITVVTPASANDAFAAATAVTQTTSPTVLSSTTSPSNVVVSRHRHQLFVDLDGLYETVCDHGRGFVLSRLQERLPLGPIFFVAFDHEAFNASNRGGGAERCHQLAEYATFRVAAQEAVKICFMHQSFPELPSPVASLRATVTMQKTALTARRGSGEALHAGGARNSIVQLGAPVLRSVPSMRQGGTSFVVNSPMSSLLTSPTAVTLLHFRLLRRLISRTSDVAYFKEYVLCVEKELFPSDSVLVDAAGGATDSAFSCLVLPVCLPGIYAASVEFAVRPDAMTTQIVLEKLTWVLTRTDDAGKRSSLLNWMLTTCSTDADRFNELWVPDTYYHQAKKFKTRCEMLAFAAMLFSHGNHVYGKGTHQASHAGGGGMTSEGALQRRASLASFAQPGATLLAPPGTNSAGRSSPTGVPIHTQQVQMWVRIWEDFFLMLASKVSAAMMDGSVLLMADQLSGSYSKASSDEKPPLEELVSSIKAVLKKLRETSGKSGDGDDEDDDDELSGAEEDDDNTNERKIQQRFEKAQHGFGEVAKKQPNDVKLRFYGLFKQATVGDINISRPWAMDVPGRAKYDAWMACKGKTSMEAKLAYIDQWSLLSASLLAKRT